MLGDMLGDGECISVGFWYHVWIIAFLDLIRVMAFIIRAWPLRVVDDCPASYVTRVCGRMCIELLTLGRNTSSAPCCMC